MKKVLKWVGIVFGVLVGLVIVAGIVIYAMGSAKVTQVYDIPKEAITAPTDADSLVRGKGLVEISACTGCHGENLAGQVFIENATLAVLSSSNLTSGQGGIGGVYADADWERAIRHGLRPDGTGLIIMQSQHFNHYSDEDLWDLIAYLKSVPPVDNNLPPRTLGPLGRILLALGAFPVAADLIDHHATHPASAPAGASVERGQYLVEIAVCEDCHGKGLIGRSLDQEQNGSPAGPNLTPSGELIGWSEADFVAAMRNGVKPSGTKLDPERMPWDKLGPNLSEADLHALWLYLQSLPPAPA